MSAVPLVQQAFALGWHVAELWHMDPGTGAIVVPNGLLQQIDNLDAAQRVALLEAQIATGVTGLPVTTPTIAGPAAVESTHLVLLKQLMGSDYRLGKAYALGVGLAETVITGWRSLKGGATVSGQYLDQLFADERLKRIAGQLHDLNSAFPDHAVDATITTLLDWGDTRGQWLPLASTDGAALAERLYAQGTIWRALLSGEKDARDYLHVLDYAKAIGRMAGQYGSLGRNLFLSPGILGATFAAIAVVALGAATMARVFHADLQAVWTALVGTLGVLGVTGAGVTTGVRQALASTESVLWDSELSAAVAEAVDWVPVEPKRSHVKGLREGDPAKARVRPGT